MIVVADLIVDMIGEAARPEADGEISRYNWHIIERLEGCKRTVSQTLDN